MTLRLLDYINIIGLTAIMPTQDGRPIDKWTKIKLIHMYICISLYMYIYM